MNNLERIYALHRLLYGRRTALAMQDMQEELGCSRSTLKRDLRFLRDFLQAPLEYDPEGEGYRYTSDAGMFELPGTWFSGAELAALLTLEEVLQRHPLGILAQVLQPARDKLEKLLEHRGIGLPDWRSRLRILGAAARDPGLHFAAVAEALVERRRLRIEYHARSTDRMDPPGRAVSPQRLILYRDNWYLDAWCHVRRELRIFSLDRIVAAEVLSQAAKEVPEQQLNHVLATSYGIFAGPPTEVAVLRFSAHAARWVGDELWHSEQEDQRHEDGALTRSVPYHRSTELVMDILRWGPEVEVLAPESLRNVVRERLHLALQRYSASDDSVAGAGGLKNARQVPDERADAADRIAGPSSEPAAAYPGNRKRVSRAGR